MDPSLMVQQGPNPGERFAQAFQQGPQQREQNMARAAYAALVKDPSNQKAFEALASVNPEAAMQFKQQQLEQAKAQLGQHYDSVIKGGQIIRQVQPKDQAGWDQVLAMAQQAGVDISEVPRVWNEQTAQYAQQVGGLADTFAPLAQHNPQIVPVAPGGGVATIDPSTHGLSFLALPNDGSHPAGAPAGPPAEAVARLKANPHEAQQFDEIFGPGASQQILGGQTAPAPSGGF